MVCCLLAECNWLVHCAVVAGIRWPAPPSYQRELRVNMWHFFLDVGLISGRTLDIWGIPVQVSM